MTPAEAVRTIRSVRKIRAVCPDSKLARALEVKLCRLLWLELTPDAPEVGPMLAVFCKPRVDLQAVVAGIIQGRSGDGPYPWRLA